jgi:hypothetical protein
MRFPYAIDARGRTALADEEAHVRQLIEQVLFTNPGERVMRPTLGTGAMQLVFAPLGDQLAAATRHLVQSALQTWLADRVLVEDVSTEIDDSKLYVTVRYTLRREARQVVATFVREGA